MIDECVFANSLPILRDVHYLMWGTQLDCKKRANFGGNQKEENNLSFTFKVKKINVAEYINGQSAFEAGFTCSATVAQDANVATNTTRTMLDRSLDCIVKAPVRTFTRQCQHSEPSS